MNHGYCKNCWWNKDSVCHMQSRPQMDLIVRVKDDGYCPDYLNRSKEKKSIDDFLKNLERL